VSRVVDTGDLDPENVVTPGIFVDRILDLSAAGQKRADQQRADQKELAS
jgi:3-oxoadipate CoA-transferase alpha subunit